jgi:predicted nucleotide-binding protein with TIR-like domain
MRVGIVGSWGEDFKETWGLKGTHDKFAKACSQLGIALAERGIRIIVGGDAPSTADCHIVLSYLEVASKRQPPAIPPIEVLQPSDPKSPFEKQFKHWPKLINYLPRVDHRWSPVRLRFAQMVDATIAIGGGSGTYQAGLAAILMGKRLLPIGAFGGAAENLIKELGKEAENNVRDAGLAAPWIDESASRIVSVLDRPPVVLLIHGHSPDWREVKDWMIAKKLAAPCVMLESYGEGKTLPEKFEMLADRAEAAIAFVTPDDLGGPVAGEILRNPRARQNVWIEVGWFWGRLGRRRVLLLVKGDVELPSDLKGIDHATYSDSPLHASEKLRTFLEFLGEDREGERRNHPSSGS